MTKQELIQHIEDHNAGRIPELLQLKYENMCQDVFKFYRGTAHLFYQRVPKQNLLYDCPNTWICGDLHFENFGSYKGDNGLVYFDINDFDEAVLGPCLFDVARFLISLKLITNLSGMSTTESEQLCELFLTVYRDTLMTGNSRSVERETSKGMVKELLTKVRRRKPIADHYSDKNSETREFNFEHDKLIKPTNDQTVVIKHLITQWNKQHKAKSIYDIIDAGYHLKGTGSLGLERYILMVQKKSNQKFKIIDLKTATPSCALSATCAIQPSWRNEAERIIEIQKRVQGTSQALLMSLEHIDKSYVLREYQSYEDKINYKLLGGKVKNYQPVVTAMAQVTAWGQLQSGGRQGSSITDELIDFASGSKWTTGLLTYTTAAVQLFQKEYQVFCESYNQGKFHLHTLQDQT